MFKKTKLWKIALLIFSVMLFFLSIFIVIANISGLVGLDTNLCVQGKTVEAVLKRDSYGYTYISPDGSTSYGSIGEYDRFIHGNPSDVRDIVIDTETEIYLGDEITYILDSENIVYNSSFKNRNISEMDIVSLDDYLTTSDKFDNIVQGIFIGGFSFIMSIFYILSLVGEIKKDLEKWNIKNA